MVYTRDVVLPCQIFTLINNETGQFLLIGCGSWACDKCGPRKVNRFLKCVDRIPQTYEYLKFLTITYAGLPISVREFNRRLGCFFRLLRERFGRFEWVRVNERGERGTTRLHCHGLANLPFVSNWRHGRHVLRDLAKRSGLGWVKINARPRSVARSYLGPYMAKSRKQAHGRYERWSQCSMGLRGVPRKQKVNSQWQVVNKVVDFLSWAKATVAQWQKEMDGSRIRASGCVCLEPLDCICGAKDEFDRLSALPQAREARLGMESDGGGHGPMECGAVNPSLTASLSLNLKMTGAEEKLDEKQEMAA